MAEPFDDTLLSRIEDASLNASAPPQQRWLDGWLLRFSPGKAKRARCINAVAAGRVPLDDKLALAAAVFHEAGLPMFVRITRFTQPPGLDLALADRGYTAIDDTRVMVLRDLTQVSKRPLPEGHRFERLDGADFAEAVGLLRGSPPEQRRAHGERLVRAPVPFRGWVMRRGGEIVACGQTAQEAELVGVYDVYTREDTRGQGLAKLLCEHLLIDAASGGARVAYLQCESDNAPARHIYHRLGFADGYAYHYRQAP